MGFDSIAARILSEEKLAGANVRGFPIYMNPTRDELLRASYSSKQEDPEEKGYRALYLPRTGGYDRVYAVAIDILHDILGDYLVDAGLEDRRSVDKAVRASSNGTDFNGQVWVYGKLSPSALARMRTMLHLDADSKILYSEDM